MTWFRSLRLQTCFQFRVLIFLFWAASLLRGWEAHLTNTYDWRRQWYPAGQLCMDLARFLQTRVWVQFPQDNSLSLTRECKKSKWFVWNIHRCPHGVPLQQYTLATPGHVMLCPSSSSYATYTLNPKPQTLNPKPKTLNAGSVWARLAVGCASEDHAVWRGGGFILLIVCDWLNWPRM